MYPHLHWLSVTIWLSFTHGFNFTTSSSPFQCDDLTVSWTGGSPPFNLTVVVIQASNIYMSIPSDAFVDNKGSFTTQLAVPKGMQIMLSMSDATGPLSGGTSDLLTVGDTQTGRTCNTTLPANDFFFTTDGTLEQCKPYPFTLYTGAVLPLTIYGYVPNGFDSFILNPPPEASYTWIANLKAQTRVAFTVTDSQGRRGGTDVLNTVLPSTDSSCLSLDINSSSSPSDLTPTSITSPSSSSSSSITTTTTTAENSAPLSTGTMAGIGVGSAAFCIIIIAAIWYICKRRHTRNIAERFETHPFIYTDSAQPKPLVHTPAHSPYIPRGGQTGYIVHQDIDEVLPPIELPPQYSERRVPIQGISHYSASPGSLAPSYSPFTPTMLEKEER